MSGRQQLLGRVATLLDVDGSPASRRRRSVGNAAMPFNTSATSELGRGSSDSRPDSARGTRGRRHRCPPSRLRRRRPRRSARPPRGEERNSARQGPHQEAHLLTTTDYRAVAELSFEGGRTAGEELARLLGEVASSGAHRRLARRQPRGRRGLGGHCGRLPHPRQADEGERGGLWTLVRRTTP